jgi:hypothetical protein
MLPGGFLVRPRARKPLMLGTVPAAASMAYLALRMAWADHLSRATNSGSVASAASLALGDADLRLNLADAWLTWAASSRQFWAVLGSPGISASAPERIQASVVIGRNRSPRYLWVAFNGEQPETCAPLVQFVHVTPAASYDLLYQYHTSELPPASGLRWSAFDPRTGIDLTTASPWLSSPDWKTDEARFIAPAAGLVCVALICQRVHGAARIDGSVALRRVSMERRP